MQRYALRTPGFPVCAAFAAIFQLWWFSLCAAPVTAEVNLYFRCCVAPAREWQGFFQPLWLQPL